MSVMAQPDEGTAPQTALDDLPASSSPRGLLRRGLIYMPAYVAPTLLGAAVVPLLSRALHPAQFGVYAICLGINGVLLPFAADPTTNSFRRLFTRARSEADRRALVTSTFGLTCALSAAMVCLSVGLSAVVVVAVGLSGWLLPLVATALMTAGYAIFQYLITVDYVRERAVATSSMQVLHSILKAGALVGGAIITGQAFGSLMGYFIILPGLCLIRLRRLIPRHERFVDLEIWQETLRYGLPLIVSSLSFVVLAAFDRICLGAFRGAAAAGRYAAAYIVADASISLLATLLQYVSYTSIVAAWEAGDHRTVHRLVLRTTDILVVFAILMITMFGFVGERFIHLVTGGGYNVPRAVLVLVVGGVALYRIGFLQSVGFQLRLNSRALAKTFGITACLCIPATVLAIALFGAIGAAAATALAYGFFLVLVMRWNPAPATSYPSKRLFLAVAALALGTVVGLVLP